MKISLNNQHVSNKLHNIFYVIICLVIFSSKVNGQIKYCYDADGNRTKQLAVSSCRPILPGGGKDTTKKTDSLAKSIESEHGITVYPNPTRYQVNVNITSLSSGQVATIYLLDINGNTLYSHQATSFPYPIDMSNLASGAYFVKVLIGNKEQLFYRVLKN
jgi:type IX secretion system substrate protein